MVLEDLLFPLVRKHVQNYELFVVQSSGVEAARVPTMLFVNSKWNKLLTLRNGAMENNTDDSPHVSTSDETKYYRM